MTARPTILFVAPYPPPYSGPESSAKMFLESDITNYFDIVFFNTNFRKSNTEKGKANLGAVFIFFKFTLGLILRLIQNNPKIVYHYVTATSLGWLFKDIWLIAISKLFGKKVVLHMRAGHFNSNFERANFLERFVIARFARICDLGLAQSISLEPQFKHLLPSHKVSHVHNMIDCRKYSRTEPLSTNQVVFFMGHLTQAKGYTDILKAMPSVIEKFPKVKFVFAGTKLEKERNVFNNYVNGAPILFENTREIESEIVRSHPNNYCYLGVVDERKKIQQLLSSSIFVLPSYSEGFSMSVLEAMAVGLPIVTTPVGALQDIITNEDSGLLVSPGNIEQLTRSLIRLLSDRELREEIGERNMESVKKFYSMDKVAIEYKAIFEKVLDHE
ncbi:glycosyltransferase family 4 protein [Halioglobus maricola]|uniref:glycosyltransferase family 4 protein n=1 Tax=Halioglobus maricola TaxID=2601894 RepID=UPI00147906D9|nr:glycosyltransferase family 4 protein [Halioglobus maricola]